MITTNELIMDRRIWAGLNNPSNSLDDSDVIVFGMDFDGGVSFRSGAKDAPRALREITYTIDPTTERFESFEDLKILDVGDIGLSDRNLIFEKAEKIVYDTVKAGKFFTMIGGDHSTTIPVLRGIDKALDEPFGIIHIDAHFDLCDDMAGDKLSHGSTERRALELDNIQGCDNIYFLGIRSVESNELPFIRENDINVVNAVDFSKLGTSKVASMVKEKMSKFKKIYITIDIDALDPAYAPGTGTPQFGGLTSRELLNLLYELFKLPVIGFDVVEVAPKLEESQIALFAARKIITECWGHFNRKNKKIEGTY